jgi:hypothetical protein
MDWTVFLWGVSSIFVDVVVETREDEKPEL